MRSLVRNCIDAASLLMEVRTVPFSANSLVFNFCFTFSSKSLSQMVLESSVSQLLVLRVSQFSKNFHVPVLKDS